jgi:DNA end-binding protein Ku
MARASWKGFIRLSLVSVPVEGYTASAAGETQMSLNQLHDECHGRIRYKKTCEVHGDVDNDQIVAPLVRRNEVMQRCSKQSRVGSLF